MRQRDLIALVAGVVLGIGSCFVISESGMGSGATLIICLLVCPLLASMIAAERIFLLGLLPNVVIAIGTVILALSSSNNRAASGGLSEEDVFIIPVVFAISIVSALLMATVVWFVRREII